MPQPSAAPDIEILICTIDKGIERVPCVLMPPMEGVGYVLSVQTTGRYTADMLPKALAQRHDVCITYVRGCGLSRNRNNALAHAKAPIVIVADDDNRYLPSYIDTVRRAFAENPDADILHFQAETPDGKPLHEYPSDWVCSVEIAMRRERVQAAGVKFDERFGLGSRCLCAGEEDVFLCDACRAGLKVGYVPEVMVRTPGDTTGMHFVDNAVLQRTKGAVFSYCYGVCRALWLTLKEAGWYLVYRHINPAPIFCNMLCGIWMEKTLLKNGRNDSHSCA